MKATSKEKLCVTQARKESADGEVTYYYSLPKISLFDIKGRLWLWQRLKDFQTERKLKEDKNVKVIYD